MKRSSLDGVPSAGVPAATAGAALAGGPAEPSSFLALAAASARADLIPASGFGCAFILAEPGRCARRG
ncbi:MAG: hypothetical protein GY822_32165 [Deltaproteobacteria bacterium]|nr:hypothetical protein [Deltaproteobacteria bacterium]